MTLTEIEEKLLKKPLILSSSLKEKITNDVVLKLGLKSKFQLNDRYEGVSFLDKHLRRVLSCKLVEYYLEIELCDKVKSLKCSTDFILNDKKFNICFINNMDRVNFVNNNFDFLIVVSIDSDYKRGITEKIYSKDQIIGLKILEKNSIGNNKLVSIDYSILK